MGWVRGAAKAVAAVHRVATKKTCRNCGNEIAKGEPTWTYRYGGEVCRSCHITFTAIGNG